MAGPGIEPGFLALESNAIPTALRGLADAYEKSTQTVGGWTYAIMAYTWFSIALTFVKSLGECEGREWGGGVKAAKNRGQHSRYLTNVKGRAA